MTEAYKFQKLRVYQMALEYIDVTYKLSNQLPTSEKYNIQTQLQRAATSIALNIAEGSTSQSDAEQNRFLGHSVRSYLETIACWDLIERRNYLNAIELKDVRNQGHKLFIKLIAFRKTLK